MLRAALAAVPLTAGFASGAVCPVREDSLAHTYIPPGWVFGLVWTLIYVSLGALIYLLPDAAARSPWVWAALGANLLFNVTWTPVYSRSCANRPDVALFWILGCKVTLFALAVAVAIHAPAHLLLLLALYWAWLDVALVLNWGSLNEANRTSYPRER